MNARNLIRAALAAALLWLAGCASPPTRFYTLESLAPAQGSHSALAVVVGPVGVPAAVDRRQMVLGVGRVTIEPLEQWAAPLREDLGRTLALNLSRQLGAAQVAAWPQNLIVDADVSVYLDVVRFESQPGQQALLEASWSLRGRNGKVLSGGRDVVREQPADASIAALVAAHSRAQAALAAQIAAAIQALKLTGSGL